MSFETIYGPVPSRRLGRSLGIDPFERKSCTHNCVYCQLGSAPTIAADRLVEGVSPEKVESELVAFFGAGGEADAITFSGSGEPTLWKHLGRLVQFARENFPQRVVVLTNGTTLWRSEVREALSAADIVVPTVAAADEETYTKLHRPHPTADFERHVEGLRLFASEFEGEVWAEVMLVSGVNDSDEHLAALSELLSQLNPRWIDINTPVRPPAEPWVKPPSDDVVVRAKAVFGERCRIVGKFAPPTKEALEIADLANRVLELLRRRPETAHNIADALKAPEDLVLSALDALVQKKIIAKTKDGFYTTRVRSEN